MSAALREFCERCGAPEGECSCAWSSSRERERAVSDALGRPPRLAERDELQALGAHPVFVAGRWARMVREDDAYAVHFDDPTVPPFRARGLPSEVLELAASHVRQIERSRALP